MVWSPNNKQANGVNKLVNQQIFAFVEKMGGMITKQRNLESVSFSFNSDIDESGLVRAGTLTGLRVIGKNRIIGECSRKNNEHVHRPYVNNVYLWHKLHGMEWPASVSRFESKRLVLLGSQIYDFTSEMFANVRRGFIAWVHISFIYPINNFIC